MLTVIDQFTGEGLALVADRALNGHRVALALSHVVADRGTPESITADNGGEFAGRAMDAWSYRYGVQLEFIRPGKPVENSYIESFNGRLCDECLNVETFFDLNDVTAKLSRLQLDYNQVRQHSVLGDRSPEEFVRDWQSSAASLRTAGPANNTPASAVQGSDSAESKPLRPSGPPPVKMRGEAEKLPSASVGKAAAASNLLETVN